MVGVLVMALIIMTLHRFVVANLMAISSSTQLSEERSATAGFISYVTGQLASLPGQQTGVLAGKPIVLNRLPSDELEWLTRGGAGVLTTSAPETYRVTVALRNVKANSGELELGLRRRLADAEERNYQWLPLLPGIAALEFRYFDQRLNQWVERWQDPPILPKLVRMRFWRAGEPLPYEATMPITASMVNVQ